MTTKKPETAESCVIHQCEQRPIYTTEKFGHGLDTNPASFTRLFFYRANHSENHVLVGCWAQVFGQHSRTYRSAHVELCSHNGGLIGPHFLLILKLRQQKFFRSPTKKPHASALTDHLILSVSRNARSKKKCFPAEVEKQFSLVIFTSIDGW